MPHQATDASNSQPRPFRRALLATALVASTLSCGVGCSSMSANKGWWSTTGNSVYGATSTAAKGVGGAFSTVGSTVSSGWTKTKSAVVSTFSPATAAVPGDKEDPTSLANLPGKLSAELYVMQATLAEGQGQSDKALESYKKALEVEPNNGAALVAMARFQDRRGDTQQAIAYFQKAAAISPNDASIHNDMGLAYSKAGNAAAARDSLNRAISIDGNEIRYRNNLATVLVQNGQPDEAVNQLKQVLPPAVAHYNVAYLHFTRQNYAAAQQQLQNALTIDPNLQQARDLYSRLSGSQTVAGMNSAYQTASNIYQSLQSAPPTAVGATPVSTQVGSVSGNSPAPNTFVPTTSAPSANQRSFTPPPIPAMPGAVPTSPQPTWLQVPSLQ